MLPERRRPGERYVVVWCHWKPKQPLRENTRRGYLPPRLACKGSGYEIRKASSGVCPFRDRPSWSMHLHRILTNPTFFENGKGDIAVFHWSPHQFKVRWGRNERFEFNKYSTNFFLKFLGGGRGVGEGKRAEREQCQWLKLSRSTTLLISGPGDVLVLQYMDLTDIGPRTSAHCLKEYKHSM